MRYLTKEWYNLCQRIGLHFGMRVHSGAAVYNEAFYLRLYKRKEKEFLKTQKEVYNIDPRTFLEMYSGTFIPLDKYVKDEEIAEEDKLVYTLPSEEKERLMKKAEEYDNRPPFDEEKCKIEFRENQERAIKNAKEKLPYWLLEQIADIRVYSLGYCTKEIMSQLRKHGKQNELEMKNLSEQYLKATKAEKIPENLRDKFRFHDCKVIEITNEKSKNMVMRLETSGGFTEFNKITLVAPTIYKQDENIVGSIWLYEELYNTKKGYEVHVLFENDGLAELTVSCKDIVIDKEYREKLMG